MNDLFSWRSGLGHYKDEVTRDFRKQQEAVRECR